MALAGVDARASPAARAAASTLAVGSSPARVRFEVVAHRVDVAARPAEVDLPVDVDQRGVRRVDDGRRTARGRARRRRARGCSSARAGVRAGRGWFGTVKVGRSGRWAMADSTSALRPRAPKMPPGHGDAGQRSARSVGVERCARVGRAGGTRSPGRWRCAWSSAREPRARSRTRAGGRSRAGAGGRRASSRRTRRCRRRRRRHVVGLADRRRCERRRADLGRSGRPVVLHVDDGHAGGAQRRRGLRDAGCDRSGGRSRAAGDPVRRVGPGDHQRDAARLREAGVGPRVGIGAAAR